MYPPVLVYGLTVALIWLSCSVFNVMVMVLILVSEKKIPFQNGKVLRFISGSHKNFAYPEFLIPARWFHLAFVSIGHHFHFPK